ncbi:MAG: hypothetical protein AB2A00_28775 [Myxococcota bacterium]
MKVLARRVALAACVVVFVAEVRGQSDGGAAEPVTTTAAPLPDAVDQPGTPFPSEDETRACRWLDVRIEQRRRQELFPHVFTLAEKEARPQVQWRLAQAIMGYYEFHREAPDKEKLRGYTAAERLMRDCQARKGPPHCEFFLGAAIGRQATVKGVMSSLRALRPIEGVWLTGLERSKNRPDLLLDGSPIESYFYYALGALYRILPDWWIIKVITGVRGDLDKSISMLRKAVAMRPDTATWLELGVALTCSGHKRDNPAHLSEGKKILQDVIGMPRKAEYDAVDQQAARHILEHPRSACGYSRDKMQDVESQPR